VETTYMPPQMDAAINPAIRPVNAWCLCISHDYIEFVQSSPIPIPTARIVYTNEKGKIS
jgi:hypothetical protein